MAKRLYQVGSLVFQYEEGNQPADAVEVKAQAAQNKARKTVSTKSRKVTKADAE